MKGVKNNVLPGLQKEDRLSLGILPTLQCRLEQREKRSLPEIHNEVSFFFCPKSPTQTRHTHGGFFIFPA
jgi:hypothetical protein